MNSNHTSEALKYLRLLELEPGASLADVRKTYKTLVKVWHPDRFPSDESLREVAQEKLKRINEAHSWLVANQKLWTVDARGEGATSSIPTKPEERVGQTSQARSPNSSGREPTKRSSRGLGRRRAFIFPGVVSLLLGFLVWAGLTNTNNAAPAQPSPSVSQPATNGPRASFPTKQESINPLFTTRPKAIGQQITPALSNDAVSSSTPVAVPTPEALNEQPVSPVPQRLTVPEEDASIEASCSQAKYLEGPAAYENCVSLQLNRLAAGPERPDLSNLSRDELSSIEAACSSEKYLEGPAAYNTCLTAQMASYGTGPKRPDLSILTADEHSSIEAVCSQAKYLQGPAAYNACLTQQLQLVVAGPRQPDLDILTFDQKISIESACSQEKYLEGPRAYNLCLLEQLSYLGVKP